MGIPSDGLEKGAQMIQSPYHPLGGHQLLECQSELPQIPLRFQSSHPYHEPCNSSNDPSIPCPNPSHIQINAIITNSPPSHPIPDSQRIDYILCPCYRLYIQMKQLIIEIRLCQSGVKHELSFDLLSKVKDLQYVIKSEYKIQIPDQILLTKNGLLLRAEDDLRSINSEKDKTYAQQDHQSNILIRVSCVHVYSRKSLKTPDLNKSPREEDFHEELKIKCKQRAGLNLKSQFKSLEEIKSKEQIKRLQELNSEILSSVNNVLRVDEKLLNEINQYQQLKMFVTEHNEQVTTQYKSLGVLFSNTKVTGASIIANTEDSKQNLGGLRLLREESYRDIQELKRIFVNEKYLIDKEVSGKSLYELMFDPNNITKYKEDDCRLEVIESKLGEIRNKIEDHIPPGQKLTDSRNHYLSRMKRKDFDEINTRIEVFNTRLMEIKCNRESNLRVIYDNVNKWLKTEDDGQSRRFLTDLKRYTDALSLASTQNCSILQEQNHYFTKSYTNLQIHKTKNQATYKKAFETYQQFQIMFNAMASDINKIQKEFKMMRKEMDEVWNLEMYRGCYEGSMEEVEKRFRFYQKMVGLSEKGNRLSAEEEERRKGYVGMRKKSKIPEIFPFLMSESPAQLTLNECSDTRYQKLQDFLKLQDPHNKLLQSIQDLTSNISDFKKIKDINQPATSQIKLSNMQQILIKTTKICHQIYQNKLNQQIQKYQETISSLYKLRTNQELAINKLKEENRELRFINKSEMESQRELRKNKSDQDDLRKKDEYRSEPGDVGRLRDEIGKRDEQLRSVQFEMKSLKVNFKNVEQERNLLSHEVSSQREQRVRICGKLEEIERLYRAMKGEKEKIEIECQNLTRLITEQESSAQLSEEIMDLEQKIEKMSTNLSEQAGELEQERMMLMQMRVTLKNKEVEIINLEKIVEELKREVGGDGDRERVLDRSVVVEHGFTDRSTTSFHNQDNPNAITQLREQNQRLQKELSQVQYQLNLIIQKQTIDIQTSTSKQILQIQQIGVGKLLIFIPFSQGIYVPLVLLQSLRTQYQLQKTYVSSYKTCYFLNMSTFPAKAQDLLNECSFILIARVRGIVDMVSEGDNVYGVKEGETYYLVDVERPEKMLGFEDDDASLRNYACMMASETHG